MQRIAEMVGAKGGVISTGELEKRSEYKRVLRAVERGELVRVRHGVYADPAALLSTMIDVERIVPGGVVCLYNAWAYHRLSTVVPPAFCIAIEAKRKVRVPPSVPVTLYYWKPDNLTFGVARQCVSGYMVRMTDLERSVCDAVKYRHKTGLEVCAEVMRNYLKRDDRNLTRLAEYAKRLRVWKVLNEYLDIYLE